MTIEEIKSKLDKEGIDSFITHPDSLSIGGAFINTWDSGRLYIHLNGITIYFDTLSAWAGESHTAYLTFYNDGEAVGSASIMGVGR